jgi:hypothetical protein
MSYALILTLIVVGLVILAGEAWLLIRVDLKTRLAEPTVLAAVIAGGAALAVGISTALGAVVSGVISASYQKSAEIEKTRATVLLSIYNATYSRIEMHPDQKIRVLIQSGILPDDDGSICMAVIHQGCPLPVLKAK